MNYHGIWILIFFTALIDSLPTLEYTVTLSPSLRSWLSGFFVCLVWGFFWGDGGVYLFVFRATSEANGSSRAKCQIGAAATSLNNSHGNTRPKVHLWPTYTAACGNAGSLTHWARLGILTETFVLNPLSHNGNFCLWEFYYQRKLWPKTKLLLILTWNNLWGTEFTWSCKRILILEIMPFLGDLTLTL